MRNQQKLYFLLIGLVLLILNWMVLEYHSLINKQLYVVENIDSNFENDVAELISVGGTTYAYDYPNDNSKKGQIHIDSQMEIFIAATIKSNGVSNNSSDQRNPSKSILIKQPTTYNDTEVYNIQFKRFHLDVPIPSFDLNEYNSQRSGNPFLNYDPLNPPIYNAKLDSTQYFKEIRKIECFIPGTNLILTDSSENGECICLPKWYGKECSYPDILKHSHLYLNIRRREKPRRVVVASPFSVEFEMLEAKIAELSDIVDIFLVAESNYSAYGDPKPLRLLDALRKGYYHQVHDKIVYVFIGHFPEEAHIRGWVAYNLLRNEIGHQGLAKQIKGLDHDDIVLMLDMDELPFRDLFLFMKNHDFPEPFGFNLRKTTYGFYWLAGGKGVHRVMAGSTVGFVSHVLANKTGELRNPARALLQARNHLNAYLTMNSIVKSWKFGKGTHFAGWHCSWCTNPEGVLVKLVSAHNGDFPRWGDYPGLRNLTYIKKLMKIGGWFQMPGQKIVSSSKSVDPNDPMFAPRYYLDNPNRFPHLLQNIY